MRNEELAEHFSFFTLPFSLLIFMKENKQMKQNLLIPLLCLALVLPVYTAGAQEDAQEAEQEVTQEAAQEVKQETAQKAAQEVTQETPQEAAQEAKQETAQKAGQPAPQKSASQKRPAQGTADVSVWVNRAVAFISQIGNLFGNATGFRIGGTTGTAIAALVIAKLAEDKAPSWLKWLLYATGGTMFAGSGANILQLVMNILGV